jgi:microcystin-dependent protein
MSVTQLTGQQVKDATVATADIADGAITDAKVAAANKDGSTSTPSMRTLGTSSTQAAPGDDARFATPGDLKVTAAFNNPTGWLTADGTAVSRTTYAALYAAITVTQSVTTTAFSATVTVPDSSVLKAGWHVEGAGTGGGTTISVINNSTTITLSGPASVTGTTTLTYFPFDRGDGSTTFNLPNCSGRVPVGSGSGSGLTARNLGDTGGEETHVLTTTEMPSHTHAPSSASFFRCSTAGGSAAANGPTTGGAQTLTSPGTTASAGSDGAHTNMQPFFVGRWIIKT